MIKSREAILSSNGIHEGDSKVCQDITHNKKLSVTVAAEDFSKKDIKKDLQKFTMIFNKYNEKLNLKPSTKDDECIYKYGSKYCMIFNKDITVKPKTKLKPDLKKGEETPTPLKLELTSMKSNDAETLMNLYGRSNLFIPELTINSLSPGNDAQSDVGLKLNNSLSSLPKNKISKNKISSLTSLETHFSKDTSRKHMFTTQERKIFRVRSLDLSATVSSRELESAFHLKQPEQETEITSDKKSRGDGQKKGDRENVYRKQVQWKSEVDVIYFESHQAAEGDRAGEIFGRVIEPLKEEWEQQRTGVYSKMVPLPFYGQWNERWQSLLKI